MEKPFVPFYKPYGMSDEEFEYEVKIAEQKLSEWEDHQEELRKSCTHEFISREYLSQPYGHCLCCGRTILS
jgi:hypothetical protein